MLALGMITCRYCNGVAVSYTTDTAKQHIQISCGTTYSNRGSVFQLSGGASLKLRASSFPYYIKLLIFCIK